MYAKNAVSRGHNQGFSFSEKEKTFGKEKH